MRKLIQLSIAVLLACVLAQECRAQTKDTVRVMFYNLLNFPTGGGGIANRQDTLAKIIAHIEPDLVMFCEMVNIPGTPALLLNNSFNVGGITYFQHANFVPNTSSMDNLQQLIYYNSNKIRLRNTSQLPTDLRDINKYVVYYNDPNLGSTSDTTFLDVYVTHLKASSGTTNENRRNAELTVLRNHVNTNSSLRNSIFGADYNVYTSAESGYQTITTTGTYPFVDPINRPGNWSNNASFADIHTQSSRATQLGGDGASSGLDDRFDQILCSSNVMSGADRIRYIPNTYHAVGQDGNHYNVSVNDPPANAAVPANIASALYYMSDHLPVVMDLEFTLPNLLPVNISQFQAEPHEGKVAITGQFESIEPGLNVELERSKVTDDFSRISILNLNQEGAFRYFDAPGSGIWRYRLKMTDDNGVSAFSNEAIVSLNSNYEWQIASQPDGFRIFIDGGFKFNGSIEIRDITGRLLHAQSWIKEDNISMLPIQLEVSNQVLSIQLKNTESGWQESKMVMKSGK